MRSVVWRTAACAAAPQLMTTARVALGAAGIIAALDGKLHEAATFIALGAVADGLDGHLARWLGSATPTGALFDYFADYLCFVVAPWTLSRALLPGTLDAVRDVLLGLPLVTGGLRYSRNGVLVTMPSADVDDLPGVGTIFYAFVPILAVFLDYASVAQAETLGVVLPVWVAIFAILMIAPFRYPKLARVPGASPLVLVLLVCMPFVATRLLAATALALGLLYIVVAPFFSSATRSSSPK